MATQAMQSNQFFVGVFQHDSGTPKHALEFKKSQIFWILPQRTEFLWSGTQDPRGKIKSFE